ncbi:MAG: hypothetical protein ACD_50C00118G0003 [uncultured bacterium]|nr:MAG: hypothetical protein ACD_50C00118G0003 [uncultured bacterium]KKT02230.1 MAG: hypothetical protein UV80_C0005G0075 [Candidatus Peregrinibacteria bacterium GW2011_GWF2_43_17]KKT20184.1 MAG: polymerase subunit beta protein [Candidatus Peregrinibacteria bacterium GW2011_GWA2_43_8]HAU40009.1 hypothetical protein [Candidatus Peregrinibacteria bacterium]
MLIQRSSVSKKILSYFFSNKKAENYGRELARILDVDPKNLHSKLKEFERNGLIVSEKKGNQRYYKLNKFFPLLKEYEKIIGKELPPEVLLKEKLSLVKGIKEAYIFGSYAKGKADSNSDVDVLIIGNHKALEAQKAVLSLQRELGREINIIDMTTQEFNRKIAMKNPLIKDILLKPRIKVL